MWYLRLIVRTDLAGSARRAAGLRLEGVLGGGELLALDRDQRGLCLDDLLLCQPELVVFLLKGTQPEVIRAI